MGSGALIRLMNNAEHGSVTKHQSQNGERHSQWKPAAWLFTR